MEAFETGQPEAVCLVPDRVPAPLAHGITPGLQEEQEAEDQEHDEPQQDLEEVEPQLNLFLIAAHEKPSQKFSLAKQILLFKVDLNGTPLSGRSLGSAPKPL